MTNEEQLTILKQGKAEWDSWRRANLDVQPHLTMADLREANLRGANLRGANLSEANLRGANLSEANLREANLSLANLSEANLRWADLIVANLRWADLRGADLHNANLSETDLRETDLTGADLTGADLRWAYLKGTRLHEANFSHIKLYSTVFASVDLRSVRGLETIHHLGPSAISVDTLLTSSGNIPEDFLRDCGVPDSWITYLPSLIGALEPIQFYSCFISYSTKDEEFAKRLHGRMQQERLRVWFAPEDMKGGEKLHEQIERAIQYHDRLLLVLSEQSIHSEWVTTELYNARQAELKENRRKLFPIRLCDFEMLKIWKCFDADTGKDLAREVREYFIPDFSHWKDHDAFEVAFARLLNDLKATEALPAPASVNVQLTPSIPLASTQTHLLGLISTKTRRLQHLEQQHAFKGTNTPPEVLMELEDLRRDLAELEHRLEGDEGNIEP